MKPARSKPLDDLIRERVTVLPGHIGLKLSEDTSLDESLRILDWTMALSDHLGFMIGDVLNFGEHKWGEKYTAALNQTGRAKSTLKHYASVAKRIPQDKRAPTLTFSHYVEIAKLGERADVGTIDRIIKEIDDKAENGEVPTVRDVRFKVARLLPKKTPKRVTSGKGKKRKAKPEPPPYEPTPDEQAIMDAAEEALHNFNDALQSGGLYRIVAKCDNREKQRWLDKTAPIADFNTEVAKVTGY